MRAFIKIVSLLIFGVNSCNNQVVDKDKKHSEPIDSNYKKSIIKTDSLIFFKIDEVINDHHQNVDFSFQDSSWLKENIEKARLLKNEYWEKPMPEDKEFMPHVLDEIFESWITDTSENKKDGNYVSNSLGAAFGQYLVDHHNMKWMVDTRQYGAGRVVVHKRWNIIAYPVLSVAQSIIENKVNFLENIELNVKQQMKDSSNRKTKSVQ